MVDVAMESSIRYSESPRRCRWRHDCGFSGAAVGRRHRQGHGRRGIDGRSGPVVTVERSTVIVLVVGRIRFGATIFFEFQQMESKAECGEAFE